MIIKLKQMCSIFCFATSHCLYPTVLVPFLDPPLCNTRTISKVNTIMSVHCSRYIFFTDVGTFDVQVARAETDGSSLRTLATRTPDRWVLRSPQALALDRLKQIVFFGDKHRQEIYKMDYNGNNYEKITRAKVVLFLINWMPFCIGVTSE